MFFNTRQKQLKTVITKIQCAIMIKTINELELCLPNRRCTREKCNILLGNTRIHKETSLSNHDFSTYYLLKSLVEG